MKQEHNTEWMDTLRAMATIAVVVVHVSTPVVKMSYGVFMDFWWIGNIIDSCVRFCVPIFLMLSGATLLNKEYNISEFYKKRMMRVLVPFLFWIPVYYIFRWTSLPYQQPNTFETIYKWAINLFLNEGISKHFWYIYMILFLYLFIPFIEKGLRKLNQLAIVYLLFAWFVFCIAYTNGFINTSNWPAFINKILYYWLNAGFLVLGFYLSKFNISTKKERLVSLTLYIISIVATAILTYSLSQKDQKLNLIFYGYLAANSCVQSIAIFMLIKDLTIRNKILVWFRDTISNYSFGIYLVHILILGLFFNHGIFWTMSHPLISVPFITLLTLAVSTSIIYILRKIPYGKYISG